MYVLVCKGLSDVDVEVASGNVFQEIDTAGDLVSKPAISLKKNLGDYAAERLVSNAHYCCHPSADILV